MKANFCSRNIFVLVDAQAQPSFAPFFEKGFDPAAISQLPEGGLALMQALGNHATGNTVNFA